MKRNGPDNLAKFAGHALVGVGATYVTAKAIKQLGPSIFVGLIAIVAHMAFDAPVSRALSELGL